MLTPDLVKIPHRLPMSHAAILMRNDPERQLPPGTRKAGGTRTFARVKGDRPIFVDTKIGTVPRGLAPKCAVALPMGIVGFGEIQTDVRPAGFLPGQRGLDHKPANTKHVLQFPTRRIGELTRQHVVGPVIYVGQGLVQAFGRTLDAHVRHIRLLSELRMSVTFSGSTATSDRRVLDHSGREVVVQLGGGPRSAFARMGAEHQRLQASHWTPSDWPRAGRWPPSRPRPTAALA